MGGDQPSRQRRLACTHFTRQQPALSSMARAGSMKQHSSLAASSQPVAEVPQHLFGCCLAERLEGGCARSREQVCRPALLRDEA